MKRLYTAFVLLPTGAALAFGQNGPAEFLPISLKCPAENHSVLELQTKRPDGGRQQFRVTYNEEKVLFARVEAAGTHGDFILVGEANLESPPTGYEVFRERVLAKIEPIRKQACLGSPAQQQKYRDLLRSNVAKVGGPKP
jgi:hypothetical protein